MLPRCGAPTSTEGLGFCEAQEGEHKARERAMCGIALIVSGIRIDISSLFTDPSSQPRETQKLAFSIDDLKAAIGRRGPDSLGSEKVLLHLNNLEYGGRNDIQTCILGNEAREKENEASILSNSEKDSSHGLIFDGQYHNLQDNFSIPGTLAELYFIGATLQLRGISPIVQPLVDKFGNILIYNGEIFGGIDVATDCNDAEILMQYLGKCSSFDSILQTEVCDSNKVGQCSVLQVLSTIKGPWAIIYWQECSKTLWFGRDAFGRRSLLVHWPNAGDSPFLLSSVSPSSSIEHASDSKAKNEECHSYWEELPCGIYSMSMTLDRCLIGKVIKHGYANLVLQELIKWNRTSIEPKSENLYSSQYKTYTGHHDMHSASLEMLPSKQGPIQDTFSTPARILLNALRESVIRRTSLDVVYQVATHHNGPKQSVPVAVLYSGGLDSMILAALLDQCLDPCYEIDLLNISFDGQCAPDRVSAKAGVKELKRIAPSRLWNLVEIDADLSNLAFEVKHVMSLINPANTYMDLNIGIALWLAAGGNGWVSVENCYQDDESRARIKYESKAKIVLVGSGADEQCAGYGRHRTSYRCGSWLGLHEEMRLDMQRIWKRNLGRDDRCISDHGKEARFPFLDEDVIRILLEMPLWEIADLDQPSGVGDKKILREVAQLLGLYEVAVLPKRAIQFGSRIARESNRKNFGSNRAANQASAGSAIIHMQSNLN